MEGLYLILGLILVAGVILFFLMEQRWKKIFEEVKKDPSSQVMWSLMQQQMEQLRGQMGDGLNKNILLLTEQQRAVNAMNKFEEARRRLDKFNFKLEQIENQPSLSLSEKKDGNRESNY